MAVLPPRPVSLGTMTTATKSRGQENPHKERNEAADEIGDSKFDALPERVTSAYAPRIA